MLRHVSVVRDADVGSIYKSDIKEEEKKSQNNGANMVVHNISFFYTRRPSTCLADLSPCGRCSSNSISIRRDCSMYVQLVLVYSIRPNKPITSGPCRESKSENWPPGSTATFWPSRGFVRGLPAFAPSLGVPPHPPSRPHPPTNRKRKENADEHRYVLLPERHGYKGRSTGKGKHLNTDEKN